MDRSTRSIHFKNESPLNLKIVSDVQTLGFKFINKVRLLPVEDIPLPTNERLRRSITALGLIGKDTIGISLRYGIYIIISHQDDKGLLIHELTHTMQYERSGGIMPFLNEYINECIEFGSPNGALEQEAINYTNMMYSNL